MVRWLNGHVKQIKVANLTHHAPPQRLIALHLGEDVQVPVRCCADSNGEAPRLGTMQAKAPSVRQRGPTRSERLRAPVVGRRAKARKVMRHTRDRDLKTLLGYRRHATAFVGNVSGRIGL